MGLLANQTKRTDRANVFTDMANKISSCIKLSRVSPVKNAEKGYGNGEMAQSLRVMDAHSSPYLIYSGVYCYVNLY